MANERYVVMTVECSQCKANQKVHVSTSTGGAQLGIQIIRCINRNKRFNLTVTDRVISGPFPM